MAKTLEQGFEALLTRLVPLSTEHGKAVQHNDSVKRCLKNEFGCYEFFETGSFGNDTGVRGFSDTDYFAVCPAKNLKENSSITLREMRTALEVTFPRTEIRVNNPAVEISFGNYASENLEVTPCVFNGLVETPLGKNASYDIPDFNGGWMKSSPQAHNAYVKRENARLKGKLKPLIRLVKAWKFYNNVPISSFYLELRTTKYAEGENRIVYDIDLKQVIKHVYDINLARIIDPMGISGYVSPCETDAKLADALSKLSTGYSRSEKAYEQREKDIDKTFHWWDMFYNGNFPAR